MQALFDDGVPCCKSSTDIDLLGSVYAEENGIAEPACPGLVRTPANIPPTEPPLLGPHPTATLRRFRTSAGQRMSRLSLKILPEIESTDLGPSLVLCR